MPFHMPFGGSRRTLPPQSRVAMLAHIVVLHQGFDERTVAAVRGGETREVLLAAGRFFAWSVASSTSLTPTQRSSVSLETSRK